MLAGDQETPEERFQNREFQEAAERAVAELPDEFREVFILRFWLEFAYDQIAAIQGVTPDLARWRYFAARRRLHQKLAAWNPDPLQANGDHHAS